MEIRKKKHVMWCHRPGSNMLANVTIGLYCCNDYSVLIYRDDIQLWEMRMNVLGMSSTPNIQWIIHQWMSDPHSHQCLLITT